MEYRLVRTSFVCTYKVRPAEPRPKGAHPSLSLNTQGFDCRPFLSG
ncbi:hypothetical protein QWZ13_13050 [Reinekea marina]|nr:hypothetical protein [Reinekea marina]MDN3649840.1 hypothetical protein [Reinekea marina]